MNLHIYDFSRKIHGQIWTLTLYYIVYDFRANMNINTILYCYGGYMQVLIWPTNNNLY